MKLTSRIALIAATSTVAASSLFAAPAMAAAAPPSCAEVTHRTGVARQTVTVRNTCPHGVNWYISREGPDTGCNHSPRGTTRQVMWLKNDAYHGTYRC